MKMAALKIGAPADNKAEASVSVLHHVLAEWTLIWRRRATGRSGGGIRPRRHRHTAKGNSSVGKIPVSIAAMPILLEQERKLQSMAVGFPIDTGICASGGGRCNALLLITEFLTVVQRIHLDGDGWRQTLLKYESDYRPYVIRFGSRVCSY